MMKIVEIDGVYVDKEEAETLYISVAQRPEAKPNWLEYNSSAPHNEVAMKIDVSSDLIPFDDIILVPHDRQEIFKNPSHQLKIYTAPKVPTLYTDFSAGDLATNSEVYGDHTHSVVLDHLDVVEIILENEDTGSHPFHTHGHIFQLLDGYPSYDENFYDYADGTVFASYNDSDHNPGVWFFHCHIDWHLTQGLAMVLVEAPLKIQKRVSIPDDHY
ncbi:ferro-O2-oxidoreductase [Penicillium argentinense]|uniref:Ferro-O2-oxidoreductase n=1 Tax=Penicillium argentinense TaxID=1131581 RepID=A0A9W9FNG1_9EURO|nr:ferro-O2-oxidoreductase [Penicillium argentinense]KAJ5103476.1 ferro-O2-oxidoreductase [Penicillium argentinense]